MKRQRSRRLFAACLLALLALSPCLPDAGIGQALAAQGEAGGRQRVTLVVPFAANGPTDTVAQVLAAALGEQLGRPVVVENVAGAGGTAGSAAVARALPEGETLLLHHIGMATAPALYRSLP